MRSFLIVPGLFVLFASSAALADDPNPDDVIGKWELTEPAAQLPKGSVFDFQKGGKLLVTVALKGDKKSVEFGWSLKKSTMTLELPTKKSDTTEVTKLTKSELEFKDANGTVAKFKRQEEAKGNKEKEKDKP